LAEYKCIIRPTIFGPNRIFGTALVKNKKRQDFVHLQQPRKAKCISNQISFIQSVTDSVCSRE